MAHKNVKDSSQDDTGYEGLITNANVLASLKKFGKFEHQLNDILLQLIEANEVQQKDTTLLENAAKYIGEWKDDVRCGRGVQIWSDGSIYEGFILKLIESTWLNNCASGYGRLIHSDGEVYRGNWLNDKSDSYGEYYNFHGSTYKGQWFNDNHCAVNLSQNIQIENNTLSSKIILEIHRAATESLRFSVIHLHFRVIRVLMVFEQEQTNQRDQRKFHPRRVPFFFLKRQQHGKGIETWPDGGIYDGEFVEGKKQGHGKFIWADQSIYEGQFNANNIHGYGVYIWPDGRKYVGAWQNNKMHGKGLLTWADSREYEGEFVDDNKNGFGTFKWADGRRYEGQWLDGKQHGSGIYYNTHGEANAGIWQDGKIQRWVD